MVEDDQKDVQRIITHNTQIIQIVHTIKVPLPKLWGSDTRNKKYVFEFVLNDFIWGINILEAKTVTNVCVKKKKKLTKVFTKFFTELNKSIHSIQYSRVGRGFLLLYKVQKSVKNKTKQDNPTSAGCVL